LTGDLTLSFWIKPPAGTPLRQNPLAKSPYGEFALTMETGPTVGAMTYYHGVSTTNYWGYRILPAGTIQYNNTWQHITITRDATNHVIKSYYNGELINTVTYPSGVSPTTIGSNLTIGDGYAGNFAGQMDDVRIYDCALTDQMVADLYKVDDDQVLHMMFDEGAGAVKAGDCSGYGFLGTRYGTMVDPDWVDGKIGNALDFDGTNDYVSCDNDSTVTLPAMTGDLTLSFWVKPTDVGLHRQNPLAKNPYGEFGLTIEMDGMLKYYHGTSPSNYFSYPLLSAGTISNGEWQHIAVTRNATDRVIRGYYNGELITTTSYLSTKPPVSSSSSVMIGGSFGQYFYGQIDDVRIYKKCLNEQEILDIARMLNKPYEGL
jgi:hypothetical protein